jgi:hypothetical protein
MLLVSNMLGSVQIPKRDYRSAARVARVKSQFGTAVVEWKEKNGTTKFAVLFENGQRTSSCNYKE